MFTTSRILFLTLILTVFSFSIAGQDLGSSNELFRTERPKAKTVRAKKSAPKRSNPAPAKSSAARKKAKAPINVENTARDLDAERKAESMYYATEKISKSDHFGDNVVITSRQLASSGEMFERFIEQGNKDRDARNYLRAEIAYLRARSVKPSDWRASYGLGNLFSDQQRWEEAERAYRKAIELKPDDSSPFLALSFVLTQPIAGTNLSERYSEAEKLARRAIELDKQNALAYDQLGVALELNGQIGAETENAYKKAIELDPEFAPAHAHLGRLLRRKGFLNESSAAYRKAVELSADIPTMIQIADVLQSQQRFVESEQLLRRALQQDKRNPTALYLLGRALTARKSFAEAETILKKSAEVSPNSFVSYTLLGSLYARQNKFELAEKSLLQALKIVSPNERKRLALEFEAVGDGFARAGKRADAVRVYRQAAALDGEKSSVSTKLAKTRAN